MRTMLVVATVAALVSGCYVYRPMSGVHAGRDVRIAFADSGRDVTVITRDDRRLTVPHVSQLSGRIIRIRDDTVEVRVLAMDPWSRALSYSTALLPLPGPASQESWDAQEVSAARSVALVLAIPAALFVVYLIGFIIYGGGS
jgi:hypothetical protein